MDLKRYFRGPLLWILAFGALVLLVMYGINPGGSYEVRPVIFFHFF